MKEPAFDLVALPASARVDRLIQAFADYWWSKQARHDAENGVRPQFPPQKMRRKRTENEENGVRPHFLRPYFLLPASVHRRRHRALCQRERGQSNASVMNTLLGSSR